MPLIEVGRVCIKTRGREAGRRCVIVDIIDRNFVLITGPRDVTGVRRRRANIDHLKPLDEKIDIRPGASDEEVKAALGLEAEGQPSQDSKS
ncbi:MAG TPA: 50S ribosomal protein L14e [Candidatus Bathyarchaeota archaeon]|nr:50S ribosomal protein L14e [Candidatus Bathyarchaeota archaeon]